MEIRKYKTLLFDFFMSCAYSRASDIRRFTIKYLKDILMVAFFEYTIFSF